MTFEGTRSGAFPGEEWFESLRGAAASDAELAVVGRGCSLNVALVVDGRVVLLVLEEGRIVEVVPEPGMTRSWGVTLRGSMDSWLAFLRPEPPPFYNDLLAMNTRVSSFSIEGERHEFVRHLRALSRLFRIAQMLGAHA